MKSHYPRTLLALSVWLCATLNPVTGRSQTTGTNISPVIGFVDLDLPAGYSLIADPLLATTNDLNTVLVGAPDGSIFYAFDGGNFRYAAVSKSGGVWNPLDDMLSPGGGGLLYLPGATTIGLFGEIPQGQIFAQIPSGFSIISVPVPGLFNLGDSAVNFPLENGESIYQYDNDAGQFRVTTFVNGQFYPAGAPSPAPGEAFFVLRITAANWTFPFMVNSARPRHPGVYPPGVQQVNGPVQQGTLNFCNVAGALDQPVVGADGAPLDPNGTNNFLAQLLAGPSLFQLAPVPASVTRIVNGRFFGGSLTLPQALATNGSAFAQVVAWDGSTAGSYAQALANAPSVVGQSAVFNTSLTVSPEPLPPATMTNFASFVVRLTAPLPGPLSISRNGTNVLVQWPGATNVVLQESFSLSSTNWLPVSGTLGASSMVDSIRTNAAFYRLVRQ
jgi:hypothetical protein